MKTVFSRYFALVLTLLATASALAMTPGPTIIRECPHCHAALDELTIGSGNTFGARFWTDGKMEAAMLPDFPQLVQCPKCKTLFWLEDAKKLSESFSVAPKWQNAPRPGAPSKTNLLTVLAQTKMTRERELYARRHVWWLANDPARRNEKAAIQFSPEDKKNLLALARLLDEKNEWEMIQKAEIFRELGKFDQCTALLARPFKEPRSAEVAALVKKLAAEKVAGVREIKDEKKPAAKK